MARIGINPARGMISEYRPTRVTLTLLTYIPDLSGYFTNHLKILKLTLSSLLKHTPAPCDLIVFDNGSCPEVVDFLRKLQSDGQIGYLILSEENIGKIGALRILFNAAPGEIIAYSDDDIFFYPGWLEAHLEILEAFPNVGMVSGVPVRNAACHARRSLDHLVDHPIPGLEINFDRLIPDEWEADWAVSTGRDPEMHLKETQSVQDMLLSVHQPVRPKTSGGSESCSAIGSANHFQFVARKDVLLQALPVEWSGKLMGHMVELDEAVDDLGCLRLSTTTRYTRHLGNSPHPGIQIEANKLGIQYDAVGDRMNASPKSVYGETSPNTHHKHRLLRLPGARRLMVWVYKRLFDILYR